MLHCNIAGLPTIMRLDRIDFTILEHLQREGRATSAELADVAGLSASPALRRQKLLEEDGIIRRYVALLDQDRVGLPVSVFVSVRLQAQTDEHLQAFEQAVADLPEVMECYVMSGASDVEQRAQATGKSVEELRKAAIAIDVQKKVGALLGWPLPKAYP